jgi:hypothetical protein
MSWGQGMIWGQGDLLFHDRIVPDGRALAKLLKIAGDQLPPPDRHRPDEVLVKSVWLEMTIGGAWRAAARLGVQEGRLIVAELRVFPREPGRPPGIWSAEILGSKAAVPPGGLTARLLRQVHLSEVPARAQALLASSFRFEAPPGAKIRVEPLAVEGIPIPQRPRPERRTGRGDAFYAQLAADYVQAIERGSRQPVKELAKQRSCPRAQIRDMLHEARVRQLLSPGKQGRLGGILTGRATTILRSSQPKRRRRRKR